VPSSRVVERPCFLPDGALRLVLFGRLELSLRAAVVRAVVVASLAGLVGKANSDGGDRAATVKASGVVLVVGEEVGGVPGRGLSNRAAARVSACG